MEVVAYELREDYTGTVEIERDGEKEEVPRFGGGTLSVAGEGEIRVADELEAGGGVVVVHAGDELLVELLDAYAPLKRSDAPAGATPISRYERRLTDDLRHFAQVREIEGAASLSRTRLIAALEAQDRALAGGAPEAVVEGGFDYDTLTVEDLRAELEERELPSDGKKAELVERLRADDTGEPVTPDTSGEGGEA